MKPPKTVQPLPRYTRRKPLSGGRWAYFFEIPKWARDQHCRLPSEALGTDYATAVNRVEKILLPALDSWRTRGLSDLVPVGQSIGTFDWLARIFKEHRSYKDEIGHKTQRMYDQGLQLFADYVLKDGSRVGSQLLAHFSRGLVDGIYEKLLHVPLVDDAGEPVVGEDGKPLTRTRRRFVNGAMIACRRAWFVGQRLEEKLVPNLNPFAKMGLKKRGPKEALRETPTATWNELVAFRTKALEMGYCSLATAALVAWEWLQREDHIFGAFEIVHYRPRERPDSVRIVHPKTGEEAWWPLYVEDARGRRGAALFPELMAELDAIKSVTVTGLVFRRDHAHRKSKVPLPWMTEKQDLRYMRGVVKSIVNAAGLRSELSFTSFRHGGFTEGADSDLTDAELRAAGRHRSAHQLPTYAKRTRKQLVSGALKRRTERTKAGELSE